MRFSILTYGFILITFLMLTIGCSNQLKNKAIQSLEIEAIEASELKGKEKQEFTNSSKITFYYKRNFTRPAITFDGNRKFDRGPGQGFKNDEIVSVRLFNPRKGTKVAVFDSKRYYTPARKKHTIIEVKKDFNGTISIPSFGIVHNGPIVSVSPLKTRCQTANYCGGLDGKISRIRINCVGWKECTR